MDVRVGAKSYKCYGWTPKDRREMGSKMYKGDTRKKYCENTLGFVYSKGDDSKAPGCGKCACCEPKGTFM